MKKALFLLIITLSLGGTELRAQNWNCVEEYTFDTGPLNTSVWHTYYNYTYQSCIPPYDWIGPPCRIHGGVPGYSELETYEDNCHSFQNINGRDCLSLNTYIDPHAYFCTKFKYTSGMIFSDATYLYGKFEICCKVPNGKGFLPSFWLWGGTKYIQIPEIDVIEFNGNPTPTLFRDMKKVCFNYHNHDGIVYDEGTSFTNQDCLSQDFHIFSVEWTPNHIKWIVDGNVRWMIHSSAPNFPFLPMHVIASYAIEGIKNGIDYSPDVGTIFPNSFLIDYIKIYEEICPSYVICDSDILTSYSGYDIDLAIPLDVDYNNMDETTWNGHDLTCTKTVASILSVNAEHCITLNAGFSVELGAEFNANIIQCSK